jgi:hypothetical protein
VSKPVVTKADVIGPFDPAKALTIDYLAPQRRQPSARPAKPCMDCHQADSEIGPRCGDCHFAWKAKQLAADRAAYAAAKARCS